MGAKVEQIAKYVLNENNQFWEYIAAKCQRSRDLVGPSLVSSSMSQQMESAPWSHKKQDEKWVWDAQTALGCTAEKMGDPVQQINK